MDFAELASNLGLEVDEFNELVELFLETAQADIEKLEQANQTKDTTAANEAAHSLKGSSGNLGFVDLSDLALIIEDKARAHNIDGIEGTINAIKNKLELINQAIN